MRERVAIGLAALCSLGISPAAWAFPWNVDMVDASSFKAYERAMAPLPEGVIAQDNLLTPIGYRRMYVRETPEGQALTPRAMGLDIDLGSEKALATGERMFGIYCTPCHGDGKTLGPVAAPGRYPAVAVLRGSDGRVATRTDGHLYLTVRNGGGIMPAYGWAMNDYEMWSVVGYLRKEMAGGVSPQPEPAPAPSTTPAAPAAPAAP
ncbi:MAG TPA: cytochrome c, partial [Myxococcota bacterium]|nr:cytochrome c [Myxococcota bacterium]